MLSLKPPFLESENLMIFSDDNDSETFYYICQQPRLSIQKNGEPAISAYAILPDSGKNAEGDIIEAGLNLDVNLAVTENELEAAKSVIKKAFKVTNVILSPVPLRNGKVTFYMAQAGSIPDPSKWFVTSGMKPSLIGGNTASISVRAKGEDAKNLISLLDSDGIAASIYYELQIIGITPVYHARIEADMEKVYQHLDECFKANYVFYSTKIEKQIDRLRESNTFKIEIEETDPEIKAEALNNLMGQLQKYIVEKFFKEVPLLSSKGILEHNGDNKSGLFGFLSSLKPGTGYTRRTVDESQLTNWSIDLSQKNAKIQTISPQGQLQTIIESAGVDISDIIKWIRLDNFQFFKQEVKIQLAADTFTSSNVKTVFVHSRVVNEDTGEVVTDLNNFNFDATAQPEQLTASYIFTRHRDTYYSYEYKIELYLNSTSNLLPEKIDLDWQKTEDGYIYINPTDYFKEFKLDLALVDNSVFDSVQLIKADFRLRAAGENAPILAKIYDFREVSNQKQTVSLLVDKSMDLSYDLSFTYFLKGSDEHILEYKNQTDEFFIIPDPFENRWTVDILCNANWEKVFKVILDTKYEDPDRKKTISENIQFDKDKTNAKLNATCSLNTKRYNFRYTVTVINTDSTIIKEGWIDHQDSPILILNADQYTPSRRIKVKLKNTTYFKKYKIAKLTVELCKENDKGENETFGTAKFLLGEEEYEFKCPLQNNETLNYKYKFTGKNKTNSLICKRKFTSSNEEELLIEILPKDLC